MVPMFAKVCFPTGDAAYVNELTLQDYHAGEDASRVMLELQGEVFFRNGRHKKMEELHIFK